MRCPLFLARPSQTLVFSRSEIDRARLIDAEHGQRASQTKENRDTEREIEDFLIGEDFPQPSEERVIDRWVAVRRGAGCPGVWGKAARSPYRAAAPPASSTESARKSEHATQSLICATRILASSRSSGGRMLCW